MPSNPGAGRQVVGDDAQDEFQLEAELSRLRRQLHVMEGDRRAYSEESCNLLRKQVAEILSLKQESEEINKILRLAQSSTNQVGDEHDVDRLTSLTSQMDEYERLCKKEERDIQSLDRQISTLQGMVNDERKIEGSRREKDSELIVSKRLRVTENRLDQELVKFNNQLAANAKLREELDHLRQEKSVFDAIHKRLARQLNETKSQVRDCIAQASHAYEERDEAQTKMLALKERSDKDMSQQEVDVKELTRILRHDDQLKEFMGIKVYDRADLRQEEQAKKTKGKDTMDKHMAVEKQSITLLEEAFNRIKDATGNDDIDTIVNDFIRKEDQNFALYNYVNELSDTVESIQDQINSMQAEINKFQDDDVKSEEGRHKMLREMEVHAERFCREAEDAEKKNIVVCKMLDEIRAGVERLFKEAECDSSTICEMLGSEEGVTHKNILQYMGLIEQRTMELIKLQQYIEMTKETPKVEQKSTSKSKTSATSRIKVVPQPPPVSIVPPTTLEEDDFSLLGDGEMRPLTREEIKGVVMKTIDTKLTNIDLQKRANTKRMKDKSP